MEVEDRIKQLKFDIDHHLLDLQAKANKNREDLSIIYNEVRQKLQDRENELKREIADTLQKEEQSLKDKKKKLKAHLKNIETFKKEAGDGIKEPQLVMLSKVKSRQKLS